MATDFLINEVEELISSGYKVQIIESDGMINLVFENFKIPNLYKKTVTTLLLRLPIAYPNGNPDMFWTDVDILCLDGQIPTKADQIETYLDKQWRRFSWHPQGWNPGFCNLRMYLEFVITGLQKAGKR